MKKDPEGCSAYDEFPRTSLTDISKRTLQEAMDAMKKYLEDPNISDEVRSKFEKRLKNMMEGLQRR